MGNHVRTGESVKLWHDSEMLTKIIGHMKNTGHTIVAEAAVAPLGGWAEFICDEADEYGEDCDWSLVVMFGDTYAGDVQAAIDIDIDTAATTDDH